MFLSFSCRGLLILGALFAGAYPPAPLIAQVRPPGDSLRMPLTLPDARALAARQNPALLAAREAPAAATGALRQARNWPFNPELGVTGSRNPSVTLMQEIEWGGQRGLRVAAASADLLRTRHETADAGRRLMAEVGTAFYRTLASAQRRQVIEQLIGFSERLIEAVRVQLREGEISVLDANLAEIELGRVRAHAATARREALRQELELKRLLGLPSSAALQFVDDSIPATVGVSIDSLLTLALHLRPDLRAADIGIEAARSLARLARREGIPNLRAGVIAERDDGVGVAFGISLPFLNRNHGQVDQRDAEVRRAEFVRQAVEQQVRSDIASAVAVLDAATEEHRLFAESVLRPARANAELLEQSYRAGKIALPTLLLLRNQLLDAELGYWDAWLARREAQVDLDAATGLLVPSIDQTDRTGTVRHPQDIR